MNSSVQKPNKYTTLVKIFIIFALAYFSYTIALAKPLKIAVIDTGYDSSVLVQNVKLCKDGHTDYTLAANPFSDSVLHGTHIASIIAAGLGNNSYCIVVLKFYDQNDSDIENLVNTIKAFKRAIKLKVDVINYSGGGIMPSKEEYKVVKQALDAGIKVVVAAGNEASDLRKKPYFPACYEERLIAVESTNKDGVTLQSSNYLGVSHVDVSKCNNSNVVHDIGEVSLKRKDGEMLTMTGTSQATAMRTAKEALKLIKGKRK